MREAQRTFIRQPSPIALVISADVTWLAFGSGITSQMDLHDLDVRSHSFRRAVVNIERRAERQALDEKLVRTFVPNRVLDELETTANQLLFGRRGVGKTHTLKALLGKLTTN